MNATDRNFEAFLVHRAVSRETVAGRLSVDRRRLRFQAEGLDCEIPLEQLEVRLGRGNDPRVSFWDRRRSDVTILTEDDSVLECASLVQSSHVRSQLTFVDDSNQVARLTALAAPLLKVVPAGKTQFAFHVVESEYPNAFALPGGHIVITTALLRLADRPEELLGVIAHEMAHITQHHHARKIISAAGPVVIFGIFLHSRDQTLDVLSSGSGLLVTRGFSQEYELEADDFGWKYLVAANIDPRGMIDMFKKLKAFDVQTKMGNLLPQAFSSHPALDKRIVRLERRWQKLPDKSGFRLLAPLAWKEP